MASIVWYGVEMSSGEAEMVWGRMGQNLLETMQRAVITAKIVARVFPTKSQKECDTDYAKDLFFRGLSLCIVVRNNFLGAEVPPSNVARISARIITPLHSSTSTLYRISRDRLIGTGYC